MEPNHTDVSKLEAGFAKVKTMRRRVSIEPLEPHRHAKKEDLNTNDLDFNYDFEDNTLPSNTYSSMQGILAGLQYNTHLANSANFAATTSIKCFDQTDGAGSFLDLDTAGLHKILRTIQPEDENDGTDNVSLYHETSLAYVPLRQNTYPSLITSTKELKVTSFEVDPAATPESLKDVNHPERLLVFFVPLEPQSGTSFGSQVPIERESVQKLFRVLGTNPEFLLNLLGRPDYWSPRTRWQYNTNDELYFCDYLCQHPRWNTQFQGAPLSVYVMRRVDTKLTAYIISHRVGDSSVHALQQVLKLGLGLSDVGSNPSLYHSDPFEIAVLLSSLSFEASKEYVARFRRYMWEQINKVDDHLGGLKTNNRDRLTELTKSLQIISQQADSHLLNANVAIFTATGIRDAKSKLQDLVPSPRSHRQSSDDAIQFVIQSMEKQKMLFQNYKSRKDGTMSLVYNLVTQGDAANNIQLAQSMKRDSTSMSAIAALTMLFLPATFTSSLLSAGIFSARSNSMGISTSGLWWLWVALTVPLTVIVMIAWWIYRVRTERAVAAKDDGSQEQSHESE